MTQTEPWTARRLPCRPDGLPKWPEVYRAVRGTAVTGIALSIAIVLAPRGLGLATVPVGLALQVPEVRDTTLGLPPLGGVVTSVIRVQTFPPYDWDTTV